MFYVSPGRCPSAPAHEPPSHLSAAAFCLQARLSLYSASLARSSGTWQYADSFNQPLEWNVAKVTSMGDMFDVSPGRCPIAPPHASLPPYLPPAASAPTRA